MHQLNNKPPKYWKIKPIEFETLPNFSKIKPYIEGTHEDSNYTSLFYADINEDALDKNGSFPGQVNGFLCLEITLF